MPISCIMHPGKRVRKTMKIHKEYEGRFDGAARKMTLRVGQRYENGKL